MAVPAVLRCGMCDKPLQSKRFRIVSGDRSLTVGPECFRKEKEASDRRNDPKYQSFMAWMRANKGGARPCPAGDFPQNFRYWLEGGRW